MARNLLLQFQGHWGITACSQRWMDLTRKQLRTRYALARSIFDGRFGREGRGGFEKRYTPRRCCFGGERCWSFARPLWNDPQCFRAPTPADGRTHSRSFSLKCHCFVCSKLLTFASLTSNSSTRADSRRLFFVPSFADASSGPRCGPSRRAGVSVASVLVFRLQSQ